ncbi:MAG: single-stranded DNA-binding protein [Candidatus Saccharibacteria bacterium]|nr:single-stranded DNA-binding protein [Candidatus Saccharibacteria bacterium]
MARGFSKAIITGNITRDPELRTTPSGASVCSFSVAVNRSFRDSSGNQQESVSFIDCSAWGKAGEIINQFAKKGTGILVSGRLDQRSWEDKNSGQKRSRVEIVVEDFNFLSGVDCEGGSHRSEEHIDNAPVDDIVPEDIPDEPIDLSEIPF